jgi:hypothetical protein
MMTRGFYLLLVAASLGLGAPGLLSAQEEGANNPGEEANGAPTEGQIEGELTHVDVEQHRIAVRDSAGAETHFVYNTDTTIAGPDISIEGLATRTGATVRVQYSSHGDAFVATGIQVLDNPEP